MSPTETGSPAPSRRAGRAAIVVAGGRGRRFGGLKQYEELAGRTVLAHSVATARQVCAFVVLVVPPELVDTVVEPVDAVVAGGDTRSASVRAGLAVLPGTVDVVVVHDAVRPLASPDLFERVVAAVDAGAAAAVPGVDVVDTLRLRDGGVPPVGRDDLVAVQTPQAFDAAVLAEVHAIPDAEATDDATLVSRAGGVVTVVPGEVTNFKITDATDLVVARALLAAGVVGASEPAGVTA